MDREFMSYPVLTRNNHGEGVLTYQGAMLGESLQVEVVKEVLLLAGVDCPDLDLSESVKARHTVDQAGRRLHYYFNFSSQRVSFDYRYGEGECLRGGSQVKEASGLSLRPWSCEVVREHVVSREPLKTAAPVSDATAGVVPV